MRFPEELKYSTDHEWIKLQGTEAIVGITDYAQSELGEIVFVDVDTIGEELDKEEVFGSIEAVKTVSDLFLPVSGKVLEVNPDLDESPEWVNTDPYGKGWIVKIKVNDTGEIDSLMSAAEYQKLIGK